MHRRNEEGAGAPEIIARLHISFLRACVLDTYMKGYDSVLLL